jgi:hypothetical protein
MSEKKEGIANLSRRQFLKDAGLVWVEPLSDRWYFFLPVAKKQK